MPWCKSGAAPQLIRYHRRLSAGREKVRGLAAVAGSVPGAGLSGVGPGALAAGPARPRSAEGDQRTDAVSRLFQHDLGRRLAQL